MKQRLWFDLASKGNILGLCLEVLRQKLLDEVDKESIPTQVPGETDSETKICLQEILGVSFLKSKT